MTCRSPFRSVFQKAQCALFLVDDEGTIVRANQSSATLTGWPREELHGSDIQTRIVGLTWSSVRERLMSLPVREAAVYGDGELLCREGSPVKVEFIAKTLDAGGEAGRTGTTYLVRARDMRDEYLLRERLRERMCNAATAQEHERKRVARVLHDSAIHSLLVAVGTMDKVIEGMPPAQDGARNHLDEVRSEIAETIRCFRYLGGQLRADALEFGDLGSALEELARQLRAAGVQARVEVRGRPVALSRSAEFLLYRIGQECVRNIVRHSCATAAQVVLEWSDDCLTLIVADNGKGFRAPRDEQSAAESGALGLQGVFERAALLGAVLDIVASPGVGTSIYVRAPLAIVCKSRQECTDDSESAHHP